MYRYRSTVNERHRANDQTKNISILRAICSKARPIRKEKLKRNRQSKFKRKRTVSDDINAQVQQQFNAQGDEDQ